MCSLVLTCDFLCQVEERELEGRMGRRIRPRNLQEMQAGTQDYGPL